MLSTCIFACTIVCAQYLYRHVYLSNIVFVYAHICECTYLCVRLFKYVYAFVCAYFYVIICGLQDLCELFILSLFSLKSNRQINSLKYESYVSLMSIKYAVNRKYVRAFIAAISALLMLAGVIYQINSEYQKLTTYISS